MESWLIKHLAQSERLKQPYYYPQTEKLLFLRQNVMAQGKAGATQKGIRGKETMVTRYSLSRGIAMVEKICAKDPVFFVLIFYPVGDWVVNTNNSPRCL